MTRTLQELLDENERQREWLDLYREEARLRFAMGRVPTNRPDTYARPRSEHEAIQRQLDEPRLAEVNA